MSLTPDEEKELHDLMQKLRIYGPESLTSDELKRLRYLLDKKEGLDPDLKLLALFALGVLLGYAMSKGK